MPIQLVYLKNKYGLICDEELVQIPLPNEFQMFRSTNNPVWKKAIQETEGKSIKAEDTLCPYYCTGKGKCQDTAKVFKCCQNYYFDFEMETDCTKEGLELNYWKYEED